ncbi:MAG: hypothetical protein GC159_13985 [Phycisphaera sp.]|nr:hypothetical protein [Phycisphaera sp.]
MATSYGALCTDFYINQKIAVKMDLPSDRETLLHLFDRVRADQPGMKRFRRFPGELSLESGRNEGAYQWLALDASSIRTGQVNPESMDQAYELHRLLLRLSPYHLSLSPLDIDFQELTFGFDLEARANQNEIVYDALIANTPMAALVDYPGARPLDVQPFLGISLNDTCDLQAFFEVKTSTSRSQIRRGRYRTEPLSIFLTVRQLGPIERPEDLLENLETIRRHGERLLNERVVPDLLMPISRALAGSA